MCPIFLGAWPRVPRLKRPKIEIREAIEFHLAELREDGLPIPHPSSQVDHVEVGANNAFDKGRGAGQRRRAVQSEYYHAPEAVFNLPLE